MKKLPHLLAVVAALAAASAPAGPVAPDKSGGTLFHPVPAALLREMSTDRPDKTESPFTVDAGHFQLETDLASYTTDRADGARRETWNVAPFNLKAGLLGNVDLQVVFDSYLRERTAEGVQSGVGDLTLRLKVNLWGNDGGRTAFAVMPFISLPTSSAQLGGDSVQGGVILPLAVELPGGWSLGLMTEVDFLRDEAGAGHHAEFINTITFSHEIAGELGGYMEFFSAVSTESGARWVGTVDLGLTYKLTANIQLDAGCNFGVTRAADDLNPFVGLSWRF